MKSINVIIPQGIGDIWWTYQKLYNHYDEITFHVNGVLNGGLPAKHQFRSIPWITQWSKVKAIERPVSNEEYNVVLNSKYHLTGNETIIKYCLNRWLEEGTRLEAIDPELSVAWDIPIPVADSFADAPQAPFITVTVSGVYSLAEVWHPEIWPSFLDAFCQKAGYGKNISIVFIGAFYDEKVLNFIKMELDKLGYKTYLYIDRNPQEVLYLIKNAKWFIGYQSGLNVLANAIDAKQVMLYFSRLQPMLYSWCKKESINTKYFPFTFAQSPTEIVSSIPF